MKASEKRKNFFAPRAYLPPKKKVKTKQEPEDLFKLLDMIPDWKTALEVEISKPYFKELNDFVLTVT